MKSYYRISFVLTLIISGISLSATAQEKKADMKPEDTEWYEPIPQTVTPGDNHFLEPPSDAIILFEGSDMSRWKSSEGGNVPWEITKSHVTVKPGSGDIETREAFDSFQLYIEWRSPINMEHKGQDRGNSGIFLQNRYELQVLDAYENSTYVNGMAGSIYKQYAPLVNPAKKPGEWQSYNISYQAPEFNGDGLLKSPARVTVIWNGLVVQNNVEIKGHTPYVGLPEYTAHRDAPIRLQDHNSKVSYRNIWIRELEAQESPSKSARARVEL